jgi:hypothetical protein
MFVIAITKNGAHGLRVRGDLPMKIFSGAVL